MADESDVLVELLDAMATSLEQIAAAVEQQGEDLRLALEVLVQLAAKVDALQSAGAGRGSGSGGATSSLRRSVRGLRRRR